MGEKLTATNKLGMSRQIRRFKQFWRSFKRSKRGLFGIVILIFYITIALAAPLLTPNDPVYGFYVAGDFATPLWFRSLPGGEKLSENFILLDKPGFPDSASVKEWNFNTSSTESASITLSHTLRIGAGSAAIRFRRTDPRKLAGTVEAHLTKEFPYHYGTPKRFNCYITVFAEGVEDVAATVSVTIKQVGGNQSYPPFWSEKIETTELTTGITPSPSIDSYETSFKKKFASPPEDPVGFPEREVFSEPANYVYHIWIIFEDTKEETYGKPVEATIYLDDLNVRLYGTAYGLLGTDFMGRDIFAQFLYGARISLLVGLLSAILSVLVGLSIGLVSGYVGGAIDEGLMRFADMLLVLPTLPLLIVLMAVIGASIWNLIIVIGVLGWMGFARVVRSQTLSLKERPFVEAAKAVGAGRFHIITRHILPNVMSLVYVSLALSVPNAIVAEAALSWLGLYDPSVISWGRMLFDVQGNRGYERLWWVIPPGISIAFVSLSFILLGYALDEILNPKLRVRR
ncbi:MAG: ABC transporter permease subunit [Candidatus Bathyarchaeia archaeon]